MFCCSVTRIELYNLGCTPPPGTWGLLGEKKEARLVPGPWVSLPLRMAGGTEARPWASLPSWPLPTYLEQGLLIPQEDLPLLGNSGGAVEVDQFIEGVELLFPQEVLS